MATGLTPPYSCAKTRPLAPGQPIFQPTASGPTGPKPTRNKNFLATMLAAKRAKFQPPTPPEAGDMPPGRPPSGLKKGGKWTKSGQKSQKKFFAQITSTMVVDARNYFSPKLSYFQAPLPRFCPPKSLFCLVLGFCGLIFSNIGFALQNSDLDAFLPQIGNGHDSKWLKMPN